jgi:DNA polymerase V
MCPFLEIGGIAGHGATGRGVEIAKLVKRWTGIPVSVGAARTKTLAKIANRLAKKSGVLALTLDGGDVDAALAGLSVEDVWGISNRLGRRLNRVGIVSALDLKRAPFGFLRERFGVVMERIGRELHGQKCLELEEHPQPRRQIHVSRSFGELVDRLDCLEEAVANYAARVAEKFRLQDSVASGVYVYVATDRFRERDRQYSGGIAVSILPATNHTGKVISLARSGLERIFREGYWYKKVGVMALDIQSAGGAVAQGNLFVSREGRGRDGRLMAALDRMNRKHGAGAVFFASQGIPESGGWRMRRDMLSPLYTTRWSDAPGVG